MLLTHGDSVDKVADGFKVVAQSGNIIAGIYFILKLSFDNVHQRKELWQTVVTTKWEQNISVI